jgi:hypothetical protein
VENEMINTQLLTIISGLATGLESKINGMEQTKVTALLTEIETTSSSFVATRDEVEIMLMTGAMTSIANVLAKAALAPVVAPAAPVSTPTTPTAEAV